MLNEIAIVEDDAGLREELVFLFQDHGYDVHEAVNLQGLLDILRMQPVRLTVLDLNLPGISGYEIAQRLRASHPHIGIIMLTARTRLEDRVKGYGAGADVYLTKPADPQELLAAVASLGRRVMTDSHGDSVLVNCQYQQLQAPDGQVVALTQIETILLRALTLAAEGTLDIGELLDLVEEKFPERSATRRSLENTISRLRHKASEILPPETNLVRSVRGVGYQLGTAVRVID